MPRLVEGRYVRDYVLWLRFSDGSRGEVDLAGELDGPVFEPFRDPLYFRSFVLTPSFIPSCGPTERTSLLSFSTSVPA